MSQGREFRGDRAGRKREFDWYAMARERGLSYDQALRLYGEAQLEASRHRDPERVLRSAYLAQLDRVRPRPQHRIGPGKITQVMLDEAGLSWPLPAAHAGAVATTSYLLPRRPSTAAGSPGQRQTDAHQPSAQRAAPYAVGGANEPDTLDLADVLRDIRDRSDRASELSPEARAALQRGDSLRIFEDGWDAIMGNVPASSGAETEDAAHLAAQAHSDEVDSSEATLAAATPAELLPDGLRERLERGLGSHFADVTLHPDSPEATGSTRAFTRGREVYFQRGAFAPGTADGDALIAHEFAHLAQQTQRGGRDGGRAAVEADADQAAAAVLAGRAAEIRMQASAGAMYAFNDDEDHDESRDGDHAEGHDENELASGSEPTEATGDDEELDLEAELAAIASEPVEADSAGGGGGGSGGAGAGGAGGGDGASADAAAPNFAGATLEGGLDQLQGVRPDKIAATLGDAHAVVGGDVGERRAALAEEPPTQMSTGDAAAAAGESSAATGADAGSIADGSAEADATPTDASALVATGASATTDGSTNANAFEHDAATPANSAAPGSANNAEAPANDNQAAQAQAAAAQLIDDLAASIGSFFSSWFGGGAAEGEAGQNPGQMSASEAGNLAGSLDNLTTTANAPADPGAAPDLAMTAEAEQTASQERAALDQQLTGAKQQAAGDIQQPMGEDHIASTVPTETLIASPAASTADAASEIATPDAPSLGDAAGSEEVAIIAQQQHQAELDAAIATAQAGVAGERSQHAQAEAAAKSDADREVAALKTQADADSEAARQQASAEAEQARNEWRAEVDSQAQAARTKADAKVSAGLADVAAKQASANAEAQRHLDDGKRRADQEQAKGEQQAQAAKAKGKEKSSGFTGWLADKAKRFVDGIKQAVSKAIEAAKAAVKRVIDAAKRLATEVIERARTAIVSAIQAIGKALTAISDALLAAFPGLRARFRRAIQSAIDRSVELVNRAAEGLKAGVKRALDMLGGALDSLLGLLEKGLHAVIDAYAAVINGVIQAAQAVADALGPWLKLVTHIASAPGAWLGKLGAAAMDGIQNHLWGAFKTAAVAWFQSKVMELLGIGGMVMQLLLDGGLTTENITQMALNALMTAIPAALIAVLVEKVLSMIIPAAGAVIAIIEGLQAAWGAVSRIIAAFSAFMAFLLAVESGSAGPLFATALAAGVVVVLDFVSNWLLKKLMRAARKVGAKLKGMAQRFRQRRRGGRDRKRDQNRARDRDRDKDDNKDKAAARRAATAAAKKGWRAAKAKTAKQALSKAAVEQALRSAEGTRGGAKVTVDAKVTGKRWTVQATATKRGQRAVETEGTGSVLKNKAGGTFLASVDIRPVEKRVESMTRKELRRANSQEESGQRGSLASRLRPIEAKGQRMLDGKLDGLTLSLEASGGAKDNPRVQALIQPNYYEWEIEEVGGDFEEIKKEIEKQKGQTKRYNSALSLLQRIGEKHGATVSYQEVGRDDDFALAIEVTFKKGSKTLDVWLNRLETGAGKHEFESSSQPGVCALSGRPLATKSTDEGVVADKDKRTRPHDTIAGSTWKRIIQRTGVKVLGDSPEVTELLRRLVSTASSTSWFMVGDGRSSQSHEYTKIGSSTPNQSVEALHGNLSVGERQRQANDPANAIPDQPDNVVVQIQSGPSRATIPKKDFVGTEWADMNKEQTNAGLRARIRIAISGLQAAAQEAIATDLDIRSDVKALLPKFFDAVEKKAYRQGKW